MADKQRVEHRIGAEIAGHSLSVVALGPDGRTAYSRSIEIGEADITAGLSSLLKATQSEVGDFDRVGVAIPGLVDKRSGRVPFSVNYPLHHEVDIVAGIQETLGIEVVVENDANAAAYGEYMAGAGRGAQNMFYATLGEGVGGGFILGGEIWRGAAGYAGEFGHVPINSEGMRLEDVASAGNIIRRTRSRFHQDSTSSLSKLEESEIRLEDIILAAETRDDFARMMLERTGSYVGAAIASVINLLNIERIIIGGEIMRAKGIVLAAIIERARELSFAPSFEATKIVEGELGKYAAAIGAAYIAAGHH